MRVSLGNCGPYIPSVGATSIDYDALG
jgi:hypothetical protein